MSWCGGRYRACRKWYIYHENGTPGIPVCERYTNMLRTVVFFFYGTSFPVCEQHQHADLFFFMVPVYVFVSVNNMLLFGWYQYTGFGDGPVFFFLWYQYSGF